jgi:hypothetical protein
MDKGRHPNVSAAAMGPAGAQGSALSQAGVDTSFSTGFGDPNVHVTNNPSASIRKLQQLWLHRASECRLQPSGKTYQKNPHPLLQWIYSTQRTHESLVLSSLPPYVTLSQSKLGLL